MIGRGTAAFGILISAISVTNIAIHLIGLPLQEWVGALIALYKTTIYPIIDSTIGRILSLFDIELPIIAKDLLTIYGLGCAAQYRCIKLSQRKDNQDYFLGERRSELILWLFFVFLWPIALPLTSLLVRAYRGYRVIYSYDFSNYIGYPILEADETIPRNFVKDFWRELKYVIAISVTIILFNAGTALV